MEGLIAQLEAGIGVLERDAALDGAEHFGRRNAALEALEFDVLARIDGLLHTGNHRDDLLALRQRAVRVKLRLDAIDAALFGDLRAQIAAGQHRGDALRALLLRLAGSGVARSPRGLPGYDGLDALVNGLLLAKPAPQETKIREPGMVFYQPTPVRVVLELVAQSQLGPRDTFYDVGSGLGQIAILVHLLSGARSTGIEIEPAYCDYARHTARSLGLPGVSFVCADARVVNYSRGTVFFLYTPCEGVMLDQVLERLRFTADHRRIGLFTYGPCTVHVAQQPWLARVDSNGDEPFRLGSFVSRE